jgi:hypothetical protein
MAFLGFLMKKMSHFVLQQASFMLHYWHMPESRAGNLQIKVIKMYAKTVKVQENRM